MHKQELFRKINNYRQGSRLPPMSWEDFEKSVEALARRGVIKSSGNLVFATHGDVIRQFVRRG